MLELPGSIEIARDSRGEFTIRIQDERSRWLVCDVTLTAEQFAGAITNRNEKCRLRYFGSPNIGKRHEGKRELVQLPPLGFEAHRGEVFTQALAEAAAPLEVDGWQHSSESVFNHHKKKPGGYEVSFDRWVDEDEEASDADA